MEVANADGFVFKRRRKEEASTSAHQPAPARANPNQGPRVEEATNQYVNNNDSGRYQGARVQEEVEGVQEAAGAARAQAKGGRRSSSIIQEETCFPPYPVGGAVILPAEDASLGEGEKLVRLCGEIASTECRNVSRTFVGRAEPVSHLVFAALQKFEGKVRDLVEGEGLSFLSKESRELNTRKQTMQRLVDSLEAELASWSQVKEADPGQDPAPPSDLYAAEEREAREEVRGESAGGRLAGAYSTAMDQLDVKVNSLCGLVASVECLCGQTEKYTKDLQTKYHKQTFKPLPHVNSPATLIKSLLKPAAV